MTPAGVLFTTGHAEHLTTIANCPVGDLVAAGRGLSGAIDLPIRDLVEAIAFPGPRSGPTEGEGEMIRGLGAFVAAGAIALVVARAGAVDRGSVS